MKTVTIDGVEYSLTPIEKQPKPIILEQTLKFEVHPEDLGQYSWNYAKIVCAELGDGWRLPTIEELHFMRLNSSVIGNFAAAHYWSYSEYNDNLAWSENFSNGYQNFNYKRNIFHVRAVRDLTI